MKNFLIEPLEARIAPATLSIASLAAIPEGDSGSSTALFKVTLSQPVPEGVTVHFSTANGTADAGADYTAIEGTLTFGPSDTEKPIAVSILGDLAVEGDEAFTVTLDSPTNATIDPGQETATGTIKDNDPKIRISDASVVEGDNGATFLDFTVSLSAPSPQQVSVKYASQDGTANFASDYVAVTDTLVFAPNEVEKTIRVTVNGDTAGERDESFSINLTEASNAEIVDSTGTGTILNDDPALKVSDGSGLESGPGGTTFVEFAVTLEKGQTFPVTVNYHTEEDPSAPGKATQGTDYDATSGTLTFSGDGTQIVRVPIRGDSVAEGKETFLLKLSDPSPNAAIAQNTATGNIFDDERNVVSVSDTFITEGDSGEANAVFVVSLQHGATSDFSVSYATVDGTAISTGTDADFTAVRDSVHFLPGETTKVVTVAVRGDERTEATETFKLLLSNPSDPNNVFIADGEGVATIRDTDPAINVSLDDARVLEGNNGETSQAIFKVRLSDAATQPITLHVSTVDGTALSTGPNADFQAITDRLITFNPGQTEQDVAVTITGDDKDEADETFSLRLSDPDNGHLGNSTATATIGNDEVALSINDMTVQEGSTGSRTVSFTVSLNKAATHPVTVNFATVDGTAVSNGAFPDYVSKTQSLTFSPGQTSASVSVVVQGDTRDEADESFIGRLSNASGATIAKADGTVTVIDDDDAPTLSIADVAIAEGDGADAHNATFTLRLSAPSEKQITVKANTVNGSATAGEDFTALTDQLVTFEPGDVTKTISVPLASDTTDELDETFLVHLSDAQFLVNGQPAGPVAFKDGKDTATGTILNDDLTVAIADASVIEGNVGTSELKFNVTLSHASTHPVTVNFATSDATAISTGALADYVANSGSVTFAPDETSKEVTIVIKGDQRNEANETFNVTLSAPQNATIADGSAVGTILNDEVTFSIVAVGPTSLDEEIGSTAGTATFKIVRTGGGNLQVPVSVTFMTADGTATASGPLPDYIAKSRVVTFTGDQTESAVFQIPLVADDRHENDETFKVVLSNGVNASVAQAGGELEFTIKDNDPAVPTVTIEDATLVEGNSGTTTMFFNVRLSAVNEANAVQVKFQTEDGTAQSVDPRADFQKPTSDESILTFAPGETLKRIGIKVIGDLVDEQNNAETFTVRLTEAKLLTNGQPVGDVAFTGGRDAATGTIQDDDVATLLFELTPSEIANGVSVNEGTGGETIKTLNVKLSNESETAVTARIVTVDGTAVAGTDLGTPGIVPSTLTFPAFSTDTERTQSVDVHIAADAVDEANEDFQVQLTDAVGATIDATKGKVKVTIVDDDAAPTLTINSVSIDEGDTGTRDLVFTVTLSGATEQVVKFDFATADGTAKSSGPAPDFQSVSGTREFKPGEPTTQEIRVPIRGDIFYEGSATARSESFQVRLSGASNATLANATGTGTILDGNDSVIGVTINDARVVEGDSGNSAMNFSVELTGTTSAPVTFTASTRSGTAASGADFVKLDGKAFTIASGQSSGNVTVQIVGDRNFEGGTTESFFVVLGGLSSNAMFIDAEGRGTIYNDDLLQVDAQTVKYVDADGDIATVHVSKGALTIATPTSAGELSFSEVNDIGGRSLQVIDLAGKAQFANAAVHVSAQKQTGFPGARDGTPSDGRADVGFIRAAVVQNSTLEFTRGIDLTSVFVDGDLGKIVVGDQISPTSIQKIDVGSLGAGKVSVPSSFLDDLGARSSGALAAIHRMVVHGDFEGNLRVIGDGFGSINTLRIGGALKGGIDSDGNGTGQVFFTGTLAHVRIGSMLGGEGRGSGVLNGDFASGARIGTVKVLGVIKGGGGDDSGQILAPRIGKVTAAAIEGGTGARSGLIRAGATIGHVSIAGDILGGSGTNSAGTDLVLAGGIVSGAGIKSVKIAGKLAGGNAANSGSIIAGADLGVLRVGQDLLGGAGSDSGTVQVTGNVRSLRIGSLNAEGVPVDGDLFAGTADRSGRIQINGSVGSVQIFGSIKGSGVSTAGGIDVGGKIRTIEIKGDVQGGDSQTGKTVTNSGFVAAYSIGSLVLDGDLIAGLNKGANIASSGAIRVTNRIGKLTVLGDLVGNEGNAVILSAGSVGQGPAFGRIDILGHARFAEILAGYSPIVTGQAQGQTTIVSRGEMVSADARIGTVFVGGDIESTDIVAGADPGADGRFGTADDKVISGTRADGSPVTDKANVISRIAHVIIGGNVVANTADYGIVAQHIVAVETGSTSVAVPLAPGPGNDIAAAPGVFVGTNFRALELDLPG